MEKEKLERLNELWEKGRTEGLIIHEREELRILEIERLADLIESQGTETATGEI